MTRQKANTEILKLLATLVESCPDQRFHQLLANADVLVSEISPEGVVYRDEYTLESDKLLKRVRKSKIWRIL